MFFQISQKLGKILQNKVLQSYQLWHFLTTKNILLFTYCITKWNFLKDIAYFWFRRMTLRVEKCHILITQCSFILSNMKNFLESMNVDLKDYLILSACLENVITWITLFTIHCPKTKARLIRLFLSTMLLHYVRKGLHMRIYQP